jgi:hypothetical protein
MKKMSAESSSIQHTSKETVRITLHGTKGTTGKYSWLNGSSPLTIRLTAWYD